MVNYIISVSQKYFSWFQLPRDSHMVVPIAPILTNKIIFFKSGHGPVFLHRLPQKGKFTTKIAARKNTRKAEQWLTIKLWAPLKYSKYKTRVEARCRVDRDDTWRNSVLLSRGIPPRLPSLKSLSWRSQHIRSLPNAEGHGIFSRNYITIIF